MAVFMPATTQASSSTITAWYMEDTSILFSNIFYPKGNRMESQVGERGFWITVDTPPTCKVFWCALRLYFSVFLTPGPGGYAIYFIKQVTEIIAVLKTAAKCDVCHRIFCAEQFFAGFLNTYRVEILDRKSVV